MLSPKRGKRKRRKRESMVSKYILYNTSTIFFFMQALLKKPSNKKYGIL
jgi:hypothetical protein